MTEYKHSKDILQARIDLMQCVSTHSLEQFLVAIIDKAEELTDSQAGFLHFLESDQKTLNLQAWSSRTMREMCRAEGKGGHYPLSEAGVWVDCIHEGKAVMHNDYASLSCKKGLPSGHVHIIRELLVPVFRNDQIVAILGLGNKPRDYTSIDVEVINLLADMAWDIVEFKQAKQALFESQKRQEEIIENSNAGYFFIDREGRFQHVNSAWLRMHKYDSAREVIGKHFSLTQVDADLSSAIDNVERLFKGQEVLNGEFSRLCKDGTIGYHTFTLSPVREEGNIIGLEGFLIDISERKRTEDELRQLSKLLEKVYSSLDEAVFVIDPGSKTILSCNSAAEKIFGYKKEEMLGRETRFLHVNNNTYLQLEKMLLHALAQDGVLHTEFKMRNKQGTIFPTEHTIKEIRDEGGKRVMVVSILRDITEQKKATKALIEKEKQLEANNVRLQELNSALKVMLEQREEEKKNIKHKLTESINGLLVPYLNKIKKAGLNSLQKEYVEQLETNLTQIVSPDMQSSANKLMSLTPSETRIANYLKRGFRTKEIAAELNISPRTVEYHRDNMRKKLGLKDRKINLKTYLSEVS